MSIVAGSRRTHLFSTQLKQLLRVVAAATTAVLRWPLRVHANRQLAARLGCMSDHELRDIGLIRGDVADVSALPIDSEIGAFLAKRASERRRSRHEGCCGA